MLIWALCKTNAEIYCLLTSSHHPSLLHCIPAL
jgi:hypothetical protein